MIRIWNISFVTQNRKGGRAIVIAWIGQEVITTRYFIPTTCIALISSNNVCLAYINDIMHYACVVLIIFPKRKTDLFKISIFRILYVLPIIKKWPGSKFYSFICFFSQTKANQQSTYRFDSLISIERWSSDTSLKYRLKNIMCNIIIERWYMLCSRVNLQANNQANSHTNIPTPPLSSKLSSRWAR